MNFLPTVLLIGFLIWSMRKTVGMMGKGKGGGLFGVSRSTAKIINPSEIGVQFR